MSAAPLRDNEAATLVTLRGLAVLDTAPDAEFDALAAVASAVCGAPIALISLVDADRQWFKANIGLPGTAETPRDLAFCAHAVGGDGVFEVPDALEDERFADNPLVTGPPSIRFYAGASISLNDHRVGTVCVIDRQPRRLTPMQRDVLLNLAVAVGKALSGRAAAVARELEKAEMQRVIQLQNRTALALNNAQRLGGIGSWEADFASGESVWSAEMFRITGQDPDGQPPPLSERYSYLLPESGARLKQASQQCEALGVPYVLELEFLRRSDGERRWIETRGDAVRSEDGRIVGMRGTLQDITDRKRLARELAHQHERARMALQQLRQVTNNLPALISYLDTDERFCFANQLYGSWLGHEPHQLVGVSLVELYGQPAYDGFKQHIHRALAGERVSYARDLQTLLGIRHVEVSVVPDLNDGGNVQGLFVMMIDVTARRHAEAALQHSEQRLRMVADNIPALVTYLDHEERYCFVNQFHGSVFQVEPNSLLGRKMSEVTGKKLYSEIAPRVAAALRGEQVTFEGLWAAHGSTYHYQSTYIPDTDEAGAVRGFYAMTFDISTLKETQRRLDALARIDSLTGLPNRRQFDERLLEAMARARRSGDALSLMFLDVDRFKQVNDSLGHGMGDEVLKEFAARLKRQVRTTDLVARLAGDEFVMLLEGVHKLEEVEMLASKIVESIRPPIALSDGSRVEVTTSVGVALYEGDDRPADLLLAAADRALYKAKRGGRDGYSVSLDGLSTLYAALVAEDAEAASPCPATALPTS